MNLLWTIWVFNYVLWAYWHFSYLSEIYEWCLKKYLDVFCTIYLNDILIYSHICSEHARYTYIFLEESFSWVTYASYFLTSLKILLQSFSKISSNSSFCCNIYSVMSSLSQNALCLHICCDCNWCFCYNDVFASYANSFLKSCFWSCFCSSKCYLN